MKIVSVGTWDEYASFIRQAQLGSGVFEPEEGGRRSSYLFRGVGRTSYGLKTTLERSALSTNGTLLVRAYLSRLEEMRPQLESLTGKEWKLVDDAPNCDYYHTNAWYDAYPFMTYLRHHGYPSPLLDWTASASIAAYFAFESEREPGHEEENVCVFVIEDEPRVREVRVSAPHIRVLGPRVKTHHRHFKQQSSYTVCVRQVNDQLEYVPHTPSMKDPDINPEPLWRIDMPYPIRAEALARLREVNITAFSLFDTEETLLRALYFEQCSRRFER